MGKKLLTLGLACALGLSLFTAYAPGTVSVSAAAQTVEHSPTHDSPEDHLWDSDAVTYIVLNGDSISIEGSGASASGSVVTISSAGTYDISGTLMDGQVVVDTEDEAIVRLILDGATINSSTSAPIFIASAEEAMIVLADGTQNVVSDASSYVFASADEDEPNAAVFSKADLTIDGAGALTVTGNYNDGITSKDGLVITNGTITVTAADDGIRGKDYLVIQEGTISVSAQGDGLKSDNANDTSLGYISIEAGVVNVVSGGDAIQAETDVTVTDGLVTLSSGGGSSSSVDESSSAKGIKGTVGVTITGGNFTIDSADDAIHSNGTVTISGGTLALASGDDGIHADATLQIDDGTITIPNAYEGLESGVIIINGGYINLTASDDGINVAGGNDGSGMMGGPGRSGGGHGGGGQMQQGGGGDAFATTSEYYFQINGGYIVINAGGDGLDSNGWAEMTGGVVLVSGPTNSGNGAIDINGVFNVTGGLLIAAGSSGMAEAPDGSSTQYSLMINFDSALQAGTLIHIQTTAGEDVLTFAPAKEFQSVVVSSPSLVAGGSYELYYGGSDSGTVTDGLYQDGTYSDGTLYMNFTMSSVLTQLGNVGGWMR